MYIGNLLDVYMLIHREQTGPGCTMFLHQNSVDYVVFVSGWPDNTFGDGTGTMTLAC